MAVQFTLRGSTLPFACHSEKFLFLAPVGVVFLFPSLTLLAFFSFTDVREQRHLHSNLSLWILHRPMTLHESFPALQCINKHILFIFKIYPYFQIYIESELQKNIMYIHRDPQYIYENICKNTKRN
jgi:hypothetical protein